MGVVLLTDDMVDWKCLVVCC